LTDTNYRVIDILKLSSDYLQKKGIENPRLNVELLLGHVLKLSRVQLYLNFERPLSLPEVDSFRQFLKRRASHEPIQYILEETEFYSLKLKVNRHTLIPRPETEILVDKVIEHCKQNFDQQKTVQILDIGTGSGNIAIALVKNLEPSFITAIDIHNEALLVAKQNAEYHQVSYKINFLQQDIFSKTLDFASIFDVIVSNPPYISKTEFEQLPREVKDYEPYIALNGGVEGIDFYSRLAEIAERLLSPTGFVAVEIGASQAEKVRNIFSQKRLFQSIVVIKDLNGIRRVVIARKTKIE